MYVIQIQIYINCFGNCDSGGTGTTNRMKNVKSLMTRHCPYEYQKRCDETYLYDKPFKIVFCDIIHLTCKAFIANENFRSRAACVEYVII